MSAILVSGSILLLGLIVLLNNYRRRANIAFFFFCLLMAPYIVVNVVADLDATNALFWVRSTFALAALALYLMVLFAHLFHGRLLSNRFINLFTIATVCVAALSFTPLFVPSIERVDGISNVVPGSLYWLFILFVLVSIGLSARLFLVGLRKSSGLNRARGRYLLYGFGVTAFLVMLTNLIVPLVTQNNQVTVLGTYPPLIFVTLSAIAIIRHHLFDIRLILARTLAYTFLLVTLAVFYSMASMQLGRLFFDNYEISNVHEAYNVVLALVLAFTFQPLRRFFEKITNRIFYRDQYDPQAVLGQFSRVLASEVDLTKLAKLSLMELCRGLHIKFAQVVVLNHDRVYRVEHYGALPQRLMVLPQLRHLDKPLLVVDDLPEGERRSLMEHHEIRVSLVLRTSNELLGYLLLGDKLSGDTYSSQDLALLSIAAKELSVAVENAKAYAEIEAFNLTLQQRVDHATSRLRVANRHLKELDQAKDEFISMASHQLRTPLTTIKGYLSMMLEGDAGKMSGDQRQFIGYAFSASERMVNLISDLLNVSRLSAGRFLIEAKPIDFISMVREEVRQLGSHASAKQLSLVVDLPSRAIPRVELDENKTRQVMMNFIDNAIYYTHQGEIAVKVRQAGDRVRFEVSDSGIGVPEAAKKHLFSKFFRAENAQATRPDGTGLGLYLAKRVIEDQGGTIIFSSIEGKGSTFGFELPIKAAHLKDTHVKHR